MNYKVGQICVVNFNYDKVSLSIQRTEEIEGYNYYFFSINDEELVTEEKFIVLDDRYKKCNDYYDKYTTIDFNMSNSIMKKVIGIIGLSIFVLVGIGVLIVSFIQAPEVTAISFLAIPTLVLIIVKCIEWVFDID